MILTIRELSDFTQIDYTSLRTYLDGYKFAKFRTIKNKKAGKRQTVAYHCTKDFWAELKSFLIIKKLNKNIETLTQYLDSIGIKL